VYTYGPVPSRRLGRSLGISPIPPKTCTYSCVYCQLGRTNHLRVARESFFPKEEILAEIGERLGDSEVDFITFVGDGEPTLYLDIGWLIRQCKERYHKPTAVITNGSLFYQPDVRQDLLAADVVLPSLDAGNERLFQLINRPHGDLDFKTIVRGLIDFRQEYSGGFWLEVMLIAGINDTEEALQEIREVVKEIRPDRLYIVTPIRPPAESWIHPPTPESILRAQHILGQAETIDRQESGDFGLASFSNAREAILEIGTRHPLRMQQALDIEKWFSESGTVRAMLKEMRLAQVTYQKHEYVLPAHFIRSS
jgi:wyosine [tRNA(Phe)-imidazoG37] synthetase (radical SAM superfamily)